MIIVETVIAALQEAGIPAQAAYPGAPMAHLNQVSAAVSLEKLDHTARQATVLVTAMAPAALGGSACQQTAVQIGQILENLGGRCHQETCRFHGYGDAYYVRVLADFYSGAVMESWGRFSDFTVKLAGNVIPNAVSFRAERAVDQVTGTPLSSAVWSFRLVEEYGRGEVPMNDPSEPFQVVVIRNGSMELYSECTWISIQLENTATGLRQIRSGIAQSRGLLVSE